jgi:hypothetical protein
MHQPAAGPSRDPGFELRLGRRFRGPPGIANGGFACGSLAALVGGAAEVTLRRPLPLERPLRARHDGDDTLVVEDGGSLAVARPAVVGVEPTVPDAVSPEQARAAAGSTAPAGSPRPRLPACPVTPPSCSAR